MSSFRHLVCRYLGWDLSEVTRVVPYPGFLLMHPEYETKTRVRDRSILTDQELLEWVRMVGEVLRCSILSLLLQ